MSFLADSLFNHVEEHVSSKKIKVSIVGIGSVGMACAHSILHAGICGELALVDIFRDKLTGLSLGCG